jgi:hypothetical protein
MGVQREVAVAIAGRKSSSGLTREPGRAHDRLPQAPCVAHGRGRRLLAISRTTSPLIQSDCRV